jgi:transposase InsO family protein
VGACTVPSHGGSVYILTCYDDHTHHIQLYFLKKKSDVLLAFGRYLALVENQCNTRVTMVRTDNGGEFTSRAFVEMLEKQGIVPMPIPPGAHAQNGRVERVHRTIFDTVRTVLVDSRLPPEFWAEAASYAAYVRNRVPKTGTTLIPQEMWTGRK